MLKKIMVTSPILILFLFSISFLPLTQITEAEAQFSNKIQKQLSNKIPKQRSLSDAIKKPKGAAIDKNMHLEDPPYIANLVGNTYSALLYELWIADRIDYLSAAAMNQSTQEVARDPAPIFIDEIRSLLFKVLQCDQRNADPLAVPGHFVPSTNYCGSHEDYLNMIRTGWQAPPVTDYKVHTDLQESCRIPGEHIIVPPPRRDQTQGIQLQESQIEGSTIDTGDWYWNRLPTLCIGGGYGVPGYQCVNSMNDVDGNCTYTAIGNNIKEACDTGVPSYITSQRGNFDESDIDMTWPAGRNDTTQSLRNNIMLRPPLTPRGGTRPSTTNWYRYDMKCYRTLYSITNDSPHLLFNHNAKSLSQKQDGLKDRLSHPSRRNFKYGSKKR
jgi:hypothetical protein